MKKTLVSAAICLVFSGAHAASLDDIKISGFGSVAVGKSNNDVGYAAYTSERWDVSQDTLAGIQLDVKINDKAKFVTQVVSNAHYDYDLTVEMAYLSYEFSGFTARAGKLRTPTFMYSAYLDVGYAYPMLRPSQELYNSFIISSYTGMDLLIPIEFENSSLVLQPLIGIGNFAERDGKGYGSATLDNFFGAAVHWIIDDFTLRAAYTRTSSTNFDVASDIPQATQDFFTYLLDDKEGDFLSLGSQFDNGDMVATLEAAQVTVEDEFSDVRSVSGLFGYRFGSVMPYIMGNWMKTSDDDERTNSPYAALLGDLSYKSSAYSIGTRWDFAKSMAFKVDLTYSDFHGTSGGIKANEDDTLVYSAAVDFVF